MYNTNLTIKVPGKLMIAGEYAVLESGYPAIVAAVNRYITIEITLSKRNKLSFHNAEFHEATWEFDGEVIVGMDGDEYLFIKEAITLAYQYLKEIQVMIFPFHLQIQSGLYDQRTGKKYGLGSSAAIVVGVLSAILTFHKHDILTDPLKLYKLACIAHLKSQGNGSGADIAASVYGGLLQYTRYDTSWFSQKLIYQIESIVNLIDMSWPNLRIECVFLPKDVRFLTGWTKYPAKTAHMVDRIEAFQKEQPIQYKEFLMRSKTSVEEFILSCEQKDGTGILNAIHHNRIAIQYLSDISGVQIETEEIKRLCDIADKYGRGKSSGAGGGDCGIAFLLDEKQLISLRQEWEQSGIIPLDFTFAEQGVEII